ncbi:hypothetical protein Q4555_00790 [Octadecabacter sp. 1_MG-2023]|uniref:hypothetical protein n=1 Tax=unclassified Octadecabacter TaxID=196158 RepID=UPI001C08F88B|nr:MULTISPECIES: hypothetical protein [unclassified Octadecabacter]MBU2993361.1 hypothetical protein [Octadecabacter sp. B2R22]MDO6733183.1 hypothetical protein [Octadecabacter sp. 1_MG-2023]
MRKIAYIFLILLSACSTEANHIGNPLLLPIHALGNAASNAAYGQRRGQVEVFVKTNHPALIADLQAGGGTTLSQAFDIANVPVSTRAPHTLQMQSDLALYSNNLDALVVAIMVVSN